MEFHAKVYEGYKILADGAPKVCEHRRLGSKNETREKVLAMLKSRGILNNKKGNV